MSTPRTQDKRHWVQIELTPNGQDTGFVHLDLNMVDEVRGTRAANPDDPNDKEFIGVVQIIYAGVMKPIALKNDPRQKCNAANEFYKIWRNYITGGTDKLPAEMAPAVPGLIQAGNLSILKT